MAKETTEKQIVFFDFDNTITTYDVLDDIIMHFSKDEKWKELEDKWKEGKIGSKECLKGQMAGVRITKAKLDKYLSKVKIDPYFKKTLSFLRSKNIRTIILSDNFSYILNRILRLNKISNLPIYSNILNIRKDRLITRFPLTDKDCGTCAHCKKGTLLSKAGKNSRVVYYIGDGLSDVCPAKEADIVFAKDYLRKYFRDNNLSHKPFKTLDGVYRYFKRRI